MNKCLLRLNGLYACFVFCLSFTYSAVAQIDRTRDSVSNYTNDDHLNGVTTYDLVLISKHILGLELLDSPYKIIAGDANKSGSVTTFDITEFRKLILGIYNELPNNKSWRFVDQNYVFPNSNPFQPAFPENITNIDIASAIGNFVAIKVGDVNQTAAGAKPENLPSITLALPDTKAKAGDVITVPVRYTGTAPLIGFQLGLTYPNSDWELIGPSLGDLEGFDSGSFRWKDLDNGGIKMVWFPGSAEQYETPVSTGNILFNLTFKAKSNSVNDQPILKLDNAVLENTAWEDNGQAYKVVLEKESTDRGGSEQKPTTQFTAICTPNPSSGEIRLAVNAPNPGKIRILLQEGLGRSLMLRDVEVVKSDQTIVLPESGKLSAGIYHWVVYLDNERVQGTWVKQ